VRLIAGGFYASIGVRLLGDPGNLGFVVEDDGAGFDTSTLTYGTGLQGMADRLSALGGGLDITSRPGAGTTVSGRLPTEELVGGQFRATD
jgi:signal transduction histidine kinase